MKISVRQIGGFAGVLDLGAVDTEHLDPPARQRLERLVQSSEFFALPEQLGPCETGADLARYEVTVTADGREHRVKFSDRAGRERAGLHELVLAVAERPRD